MASNATLAGVLPPREDNYVLKGYVISSVLATMATVAVILRFIARRLTGVGLWWDDWFAAVSLVWIWGFFGTFILILQHQGGLHIEYVSPANQQFYRLGLYCIQIFYAPLPQTMKISALFLFKRIFIKRRTEILIDCLILFLLLWAVVACLVAAFSCKPIHAFWTQDGKCFNEFGWALTYGVLSIIMDVVVWAIPIPQVWCLNLQLSRKLLLSGIFLLGLMDCILDIIRVVHTIVHYSDTADFTYTWTPTMWWGLIHTCLGIVVISLPTTNIFLTKFLKLFSPYRHRSRGSSRSRYGLEAGSGSGSSSFSLGSWIKSHRAYTHNHSYYSNGRDADNDSDGQPPMTMTSAAAAATILALSQTSNHARPTGLSIDTLELEDECKRQMQLEVQSNRIAVALRKDSDDESDRSPVPENRIRVVNEFTLESSSSSIRRKGEGGKFG